MSATRRIRRNAERARAKGILDDRLPEADNAAISKRKVELVARELGNVAIPGDLSEVVAFVTEGDTRIVPVAVLYGALDAGLMVLHPDTMARIESLLATPAVLACLVDVDGWMSVIGMPCRFVSRGGEA